MNFKDPSNFRYIIAFSLLSGKNIIIENTNDFKDYEMTFIDLIFNISKNSKIIFTNSKKTLNFKPGSIEVDIEKEIDFDCQNMRSITYFLEPLIFLGLFSNR